MPKNIKLIRTVGGKAVTSTPVAIAAVSFHPGTKILSVTPTSPLQDGNYKVTLAGSIKNTTGSQLSSGFNWQFAIGSSATWISPTSGNWNVGANWLAGTPPQAGDDVTIAVPNVTVTFN